MSAFSMSDEQMLLFRKMTATQKMVAIEILAGKTPLDAWRACKPESVAADATAIQRVKNILKHPNVKRFMESMQVAAVNDAIMTREEAMKKLTVIGRGDFANLVEFGKVQVGETPNGQPVYQAVWVFKDSALMDPNALATISELMAGKEGFKIKQHSPMAAIKQLSEMAGWDAPKKHDVTSSDGSMTPKPAIDPSQLSKNTLEELLKARDGD